GHTDNVGSRSYNQNLSEDRALALFEMLVAMGVEEERMSYSGRGEMDPLVDNDSEENRAKNRRVEINFIIE
ncbi:MAG: OmpA family protein, partial [Bacteroidota bacterium]